MGKLGKTEERFLIKQADVPSELGCEEDMRDKRSCVLDRSTNMTRFEVPSHLPRPSLFQCSYQGSAGWSTSHLLYEELGLRGG